MESSSGWLLGIDLGTSNTAAVAFGPSQPGPVSILHGRQRPVLPSVVSLKNPRLPIVGWLARDMMLTDPTTTIYGWKRFIGRNERSEYVSRHRERFP
ncbi:MAG: Hsp70 family protein, partial [Myxococcota bacterium]